MKSRITILFLAAMLISCTSTTIPNTLGTPAPSSTATMFLTTTVTATRRIRPTQTVSDAPAITPLPPTILQDIFGPIEDGIPVNQYAGKDAGFQVEMTADPDCRHREQYGMRLTNTVPNSLGGFWGIEYSFTGTPHNTGKFKYLDFWVKGKSGNETLSIWAGSPFGGEMWVESESYATISAAEWRLAHIPLTAFAQNQWIEYITTLQFWLTSNNETGSVCIDEISFVR